MARAIIRRSRTPVRTTRPKPVGRRPLIQAEMKVGAANDRHEIEADRVADNVMNMGAPPVAAGGAAGADGIRRKEKGFRGFRAAIQRSGEFGNPEHDEEEIKNPGDQPLRGKFMDGAGEVHSISRVTQQEETDKIDKKPMFMVQRECAKCAGEDKDRVQAKSLQRHGGAGGFTASPQVASNVNAMKSGGSPLSESTRSFLEPRFGADLSHVRVHTDSRAANTADAIQAKAFTSGNHIAFNQGQYKPGTSDGMRLLAHEVTHTFQQGASVRTSRLQRAPEGVLQRNPRRACDSPLNIRGELDVIKRELGPLSGAFVLRGIRRGACWYFGGRLNFGLAKSILQRMGFGYLRFEPNARLDAQWVYNTQTGRITGPFGAASARLKISVSMREYIRGRSDDFLKNRAGFTEQVLRKLRAPGSSDLLLVGEPIVALKAFAQGNNIKLKANFTGRIGGEAKLGPALKVTGSWDFTDCSFWRGNVSLSNRSGRAILSNSRWGWECNRVFAPVLRVDVNRSPRLEDFIPDIPILRPPFGDQQIPPAFN